MYTYYLGSRYYVPQFCRFFNADKHSDTQTGVLSTNMFAYCNNNPVMCTDPKGEVATFFEQLKSIFNKLSYLIYTIKGLNRSIREFYNAGAIDIFKDNNSYNTASIVIDLEFANGTKTFSDVLYHFYEKMGSEIFETVRIYALDDFNSIIGRNFLFTDECVTYEIQEHIYGYWWSIGKDVDANIAMKLYGIAMPGDMKTVVKKSCRIINLSEYDVKIWHQAFVFNYYNNIRSEYYKKQEDPYWHGFIRMANVNDDEWKM